MRSSLDARLLLTGAFGGAISALVFAAIHEWMISDIWSLLIPMLIAGAIAGSSLAWTYGLLFPVRSVRSWLYFNATYVVLLVLLGVASLIIYEPITTIPALMVANEAPRELIREALPLSVGYTLLAAVVIGALWVRKLGQFAAVLLTTAIVVVLLGLNFSVLGLVHLTHGAASAVGKSLVLILALNAVYAGVVAGMEWRRTFAPTEAAVLTPAQTVLQEQE